MTTDNQTLGLIGSSRSPIRVSLGEYEGIRLVDIRKHYFEKTTHELKPTTKGIAVGLGNFRELQSLLASHEDEIVDWLEGAAPDAHVKRARQDHLNAIDARESARSSTVPYTVERAQQKSQTFFMSESHGGKDHLVLNELHPFVKELEGVCENDKDAGKLIFEVLAAFHRAKSLFVNSEEHMSPNEIFETLEYNWGLYLGRALGGSKTI